MGGKVDVEFSDAQIEIIKRISTGALKLKDMEAVASLVSGIEENSLYTKKGAVSYRIFEAIEDSDFNSKLIKEWIEDQRECLDSNLGQCKIALYIFIEKMINILGENYCVVDIGKHFEEAMESKNLLTINEENPVFKMFMKYYSHDLKGASKFFQKLLELYDDGIVEDVFDHAFMSLKDLKINIAVKIASRNLSENHGEKGGVK